MSSLENFSGFASERAGVVSEAEEEGKGGVRNKQPTVIKELLLETKQRLRGEKGKKWKRLPERAADSFLI